MVKHTKLPALILAAGMLFTSLSASAAEPNVCLPVRDLDNTIPRDGRTIDFKMKDGTVWRNSLKGDCSDLKFSGFAFVIRGIDEICSNMLEIYVLRSEQTCHLGDFTKLPTPAKTAAPAPAAK